MLNGIDISNWQNGLNIPEYLDFAIMKATGGTGYVDPCCDNWVNECEQKDILWGFYHFAGDGYTPNPENEAIFFYNNTKDYVKKGIPILDIEDSRISDWGNYAQRFVDKYHAITNVWPMVYCAASFLQCFSGFPLVEKCGLWIAGYPDERTRYIGDIPDFPYSVNPWSFAAIWQYTGSGKIANYNDTVDLDVAYMDRQAWSLYANPEQEDDTSKISESITSPQKETKKWTFENSKIKVDIELK